MVRKVCGSIVIILIPVIIVLGVFMNGGRDTLTFPSYAELYGFFSTQPDAITIIREAFSSWQTGFEMVQSSFQSITDWNSFWGAIGSFFEYIGQFLWSLMRFLALPFEYVAWMFGHWFGLR